MIKFSKGIPEVNVGRIKTYKYSGSVTVMLQKDLGITAFHKLFKRVSFYILHERQSNYSTVFSADEDSLKTVKCGVQKQTKDVDKLKKTYRGMT